MVNFREFLRYESGSLIWIKKPGNRSTVKIGSIAGTRCQQGYVRVRLFGKSYLAHRVVWELISGLIPSGMQVDHINHIRDDNRIENLRVVTNAENGRNRSIHPRNKSGCVGVRFNSKDEKWVARIRFDGNDVHLGNFDKKDDAILARKKAERQAGFHENHGTIPESQHG